ncbi:MAG: transglycosylase SLT domain-containing protein [Candidatus Fermentibacteraceae bacterium]|nr:transglycosylase SLT domain-containing protein [Candidatus Fermentibacteraceae bacterium]
MKRIAVACVFVILSCGKVSDSPESVSGAERSYLMEVAGDSLLVSGEGDAASLMFTSAALLLQPGSERRAELAEKASDASVSGSVVVARLLLETPGGTTPFRALRTGGSRIAPDIMSGLTAGRFVLPDYVALVAAESLVVTDPAYALEFLQMIRSEFPGTAEKDRLLATYRAALGSGDIDLQQQCWNTAFDRDDDILRSKFYHFRGMARGVYGFNDFVDSFNLWPAGDIHAAAYQLLRDTLLADSSLANMVADPFYSGGLWNEVYDLSVNSAFPPAHIVYLGGRTRDRLGRHDLAVEVLSGYLDKWPRGSDAPNACIYLARDMAALGLVDQAMQKLDYYENTWPDHSRISNLPWYRGSLLAENGFWERSIPFFAETVSRYPANTTVDDAQFYGCLALMKTGRTAEAVEAFGNFNSRWTQSVYRPSSRYWYGVLKMQSGDESGRGVLERLISDKPFSLPARFARQYLGVPGWRPFYTDEQLEVWMARNGKPSAVPPQSAVDGVILLQAGCRKWALDLFSLAEQEVGSVYGLAAFYLENNVWERGPSAAWQIWSLEGDNRPLDLWRLRYPAAWTDDVTDATAQFNMDPKLLWSIMKQESAFQPECFSSAGARGLIQMIPSTSEYVAIEHGWQDSYTPDILYDPATSILYGTACISGYGEDFSWDIPGTLAGYNGGPHNALRWGWGTVSTEEFFSRITYNETKKYVEIVSHNYDIYKEIWPEFN